MNQVLPIPEQPIAATSEQKSNPLRVLPKELQKPATFFFTMNVHLLKHPAALAARLHLYAEKYRLSGEELRTVLGRISTPDRQSRHEHAGILLADLAREVNTVLGERTRRTPEPVYSPPTPEELARLRVFMDQFMTSDVQGQE